MICSVNDFFNGGSFSIDLIFCNEIEIISECGIDHSFAPTCHHNLIFTKISANMSLPPSYSKEI